MPSLPNTTSTIMDHLAVQCKKKLETFRIKELKDVLSRIGAGKQGKKQVLVDKIMAILLSAERGPSTGLKLESLIARSLRSREDVARIVDDVYRMRRFGAPDLASSMADNGIRDGLFHSTRQSLPDATDSKTRCPCGSTMEFGSMIQCDAPSCLAWQHVNCVIVPEKEDMKPEIPTKFFCEVCRIQHGDPFCVSVAHPLMPIKTIATIVYSPEGGASVMQNLESSFTLTRNHWELLQYPDYDVQIWCVLLGDEVAFRMHWPLKADLSVNGDSVRVTNRPGQQKLGTNGRDDGPVISNHTREGLNSISFTAYDGRSFCLGVRIVHRLTVDQVLSQIPSEAEGESLDVALARVRRCIGGGGAVGDDSDSDLEVVSEWVTVNLRCPMSGSRIKLASRFKPCMHMCCFDLHTFVQLNQRARKWQCPSCLKNYSLKDLVIDPFFTQVARALESYDEDVSEVEMKPDGFWRPKLDGDAKSNESWRSPVTTTDVNNFHLPLNSVKVEEGVSVEQVPLKIGFKRTQDGLWKVNGTKGPADFTKSDTTPGHNYEGKNGARSHNSTASVSREVSSVNQEPIKFYKHVGMEEVEVNSCPFNAPVNAYLNGFFGGVSDQGLTAEIIVLSDEEDNLTAFNTGAEGPDSLYTNRVEVQENDGGCFLDLHGGFLPNYPEAGIPMAEVGSCQPTMTVAVDFLGVGQEPSTFPAQKEMWQTENQVGSYDFLSSAPESSMRQSSHHLDRSTAMQAYTPSVFLNQFSRAANTLDTTGTNPCEETPVTCVQGYQICKESSKELTGSDPSLREFLPHQPARSAANLTGHEIGEALTDDMQDGWFSLSLGGSESFNAAAPLYESSAQRTQINPLVESGGSESFNAAAPLYELSAQRTQINPLVESASVLLDLSHHKTRVDGSFFGSRRTKGSTITPPDQYQTNYLCIDSDSD